MWSSFHFIAFSLVLQAVADIIRTTLGPRSMLKMLLDASGGVSIFPPSGPVEKWNFFEIIFCHCLIVPSSFQWFPSYENLNPKWFLLILFLCTPSHFLTTLFGFNRDRCHQWWKCHSPGIGYCTSSSKSMFSINVLFSLYLTLYPCIVCYVSFAIFFLCSQIRLVPVIPLLFSFAVWCFTDLAWPAFLLLTVDDWT